jgi:uncharacterized membrane protein YebE (DUF533 family)
MKIDRPNASPLTRSDLDHLETLQALVQAAVADGVVTAAEKAQIDTVIWADGQATPEELNLVQALIWRKVQAGDLMLEWN